MSSFNKNTAVTYVPVDLSGPVQKEATERKFEKTLETNFEKSGFFTDTIDFKIDPQVATQMGLSAARSKEGKRVFDAEVLKFVQSIKDDAYTEAYKLGREEGIKVAKAEALITARDEINSKLTSIVKMIQSLENFRQKMYSENEVEIVRFCYFIAEKIILKEVKQNKDYVLEIIKKMIPADETSEIRLSAADHAFIQSHIQTLEKDLNAQAIKFEVDEALKEGDVIVETQNGILDGTLKTRLEKLKRAIEQME